MKRSFGLMSAAGTFALAAATWLPASPALAAGSDGAGDTARCSALAKAPAIDGLEIEQAELVAAGPLAGGPGGPPGLGAPPQLPAHCLVRGMIGRRVGVGGRAFGIGFEVRLPLDWNGRFILQGGAGLDGQLQPAIARIANSGKAPALARGFAVASTDGGHRGPIVDASFGVDQQARIDYAYGAIDKTTVEAKRLIAQFYGRKARYSYMLGCSNGGRQSMVASQRLPLYFDGIVAGDPSMRFSRVALDELWNYQTVARIAPRDAAGKPIIAKAFSDSDLALVKDAVLKRCDAKDGLADGMINDWQRCDFDPGVVQCKPGQSEGCLSSAQVGALRALHDGPRTSDGKSIYGPFNYDTGIASSAWRGMRLGSSQTAVPNAADATLGLGQLKYYQLTPPEPDIDPLAATNFDQLLERVRQTAALGDGDNPYVNSFTGHARMIVYNGLSDQGLASSTMVDWYQQALAAGGDSAREGLRLYLVPGMLHCGGGEATDQFEMLDAIMAWVEEGKAPDAIVATSQQKPAVSRPLCPFPQVARYRSGNPDQASSFACVP